MSCRRSSLLSFISTMCAILFNLADLLNNAGRQSEDLSLLIKGTSQICDVWSSDHGSTLSAPKDEVSKRLALHAVREPDVPSHFASHHLICVIVTKHGKHAERSLIHEPRSEL